MADAGLSATTPMEYPIAHQILRSDISTEARPLSAARRVPFFGFGPAPCPLIVRLRLYIVGDGVLAVFNAALADRTSQAPPGVYSAHVIACILPCIPPRSR